MWIVAAASVMLVVVLLLVPFDVVIDAEIDAAQPQPAVSARVRWLVFTWRIDRPGTGRARPTAPHAPRVRRGHRFNALAAMQSPGLLTLCGRLLRRVAGLMRPGNLRVRGRVGLDNPADTAMCAAWVYSLRAVGTSSRAVVIEPDFLDAVAVIEGEAHVRWSRSLASLLWPCVAFVSAPAFWRAIRAGRR